MKNFFTTKNLVKTAMVAAIYGALTLFISPIAYGPIQLRLTEVMVLLAFIDFGYVPGLVLGCVIANLFSPIGIADVVFGSLATFIAVIMVSKTKNLLLATLWPSIVNGLIIALELYFISKVPFWLSFGEVAIGEFIVVTCIGYPVFRSFLKDERLVKFLKFD
ncbi:QueT transporter family protein [Clostridium akagii]|uniref:QueT transporter family protein n=1 Tax=Clostridium akagii TaxID=91623 RepID=UPI000478EC29|nr:QueT transporter family protein [Clostridium akagii]